MSDEIGTLLTRLERNDATAMSELYALTSSHLHGVIREIIDDEAASAAILKCIYSDLWAHRKQNKFGEENPLCQLRAMTHRYAMDYKFAGNIGSIVRDAPICGTKIEYEKSLALTPADQQAVRQAYLNDSHAQTHQTQSQRSGQAHTSFKAVGKKMRAIAKGEGKS